MSAAATTMTAPAATAARPASSKALVQAHDLAKTFDVSAPWLNRVLERKPRQLLHAVDGVSFSIEKGQTLALVGESGCGKSVTALSIMRLLPTPPARSVSGSIHFDGRELTSVHERELQELDS